MPFPADGPTTAALVTGQLSLTDDRNAAYIDQCVEAVNVMVRQLRVAQAADTDPAPADWSGLPDVVLGATMMASRLVRRRNTPDGVSVLADQAVYVSRSDPDIAQLLKLGAYQRPVVG